ncbi:MAG: hypothetical protein EPO23_06610 [Xanthobacteraceae bacterium]|nr:MAG: hypothetical protein EPO23_06610 [Xanthobacteraceae bacterium]
MTHRNKPTNDSSYEILQKAPWERPQVHGTADRQSKSSLQDFDGATQLSGAAGIRWRGRSHGPHHCWQRKVAAVAPNVLDRSFEASAPNRKWIADFNQVAIAK